MNRYLLFNFLYVFIFLVSSSVFSNEVRIPADRYDRHKLPNVLLQSALSRSDKYRASFPFGDIESLPLSTRIQSLRNNEVDVFCALSKPDYEKEFEAIYIPLYRGLMGMRLAIIKRDNQDIFKNIRTLNDLKRYTAGQGKLWADTKILGANNLPLVTELKYSNMFRMLEAERFDYFPRGAHEPWSEVKDNAQLDLMVDPHLMLWYDAPFYIFVKKSNTTLATFLTEQFNNMITDGEFTKLFYNDPEVIAALTNANLADRTIIKLKNPYLTSNTPMHRPELWYNPKDRLENF